jgi:hypothetical protein
MTVQDAFRLDGGDVLSPGDDDVLAPVADLDVAVRVHHRQVAGQEAAAAGGLPRRLLIPVAAEHDVVAADRDLAGRLAVGRHVPAVAVQDAQRPGDDVGRSLPGARPGPLLRIKAVPLRLPLIDRERAVGPGQAVQVGHGEAHRRHPGQQRRRRRSAAGLHAHLVIEDPRRRVFGDHGQHGRRGAEVRDPPGPQQPPDLGRLDGPQAHVRPPGRRDRPGEAPAAAVEHRQRPQVPGARAQPGVARHRRRLQVRAPVVVHHPLRPSRGPAGVVDRPQLALIGRTGARLGGVRDPGLPRTPRTRPRPTPRTTSRAPSAPCSRTPAPRK